MHAQNYTYTTHAMRAPWPVIKALGCRQVLLLEGVAVGDDGAHNHAPHNGDAQAHADSGDLWCIHAGMGYGIHAGMGYGMQ